jgi:hypothetical protein
LSGVNFVFLPDFPHCGLSMGVPKPILALLRNGRKFGPSKGRDDPH